MVRLQACFRSAGWQWPFRSGDVLRVYQGLELVCELSEDLLRTLVVHYLVGHDLSRQVGAAAVLPAPARRPLARVRASVDDAERRAVLRATRRSRRRRP